MPELELLVGWGITVSMNTNKQQQVIKSQVTNTLIYLTKEKPNKAEHKHNQTTKVHSRNFKHLN